MKKWYKTISLSLILTLILPISSIAISSEISRIYGKDRYETSVKVADELSNSYDKVILASGEKFPDALAGSVLTYGKYPILLTSKNRLDHSAREKISKAKEVYILGGKDVISIDIENNIKTLEKKVSRISGKDRYETSMKIADFFHSKDIIIVNGDKFPDSVTSSGIALLNNKSILFVKSNKIPSNVKKYIKGLNPNSITIIGGNKSINYKVEKELTNFSKKVSRISGKDRYSLSMEVANRFSSFKNIIVVSGEDFADALVASSISGKLKAPILLVDKDSVKSTTDYIKNNKNIESIKVIGGPNMISEYIYKNINNIVNKEDDKNDTYKPDDKKLADLPANGIWYGTAFEGFGVEQNGASIVKAEIKDGKVISLEAIKNSGTGREYITSSKSILPLLKGKNIEELDSILSKLSNGDGKNKGDVYADAVTGATRTARGYVLATKNAIERAKKFAYDKKEQKVAYIKIAGEREYQPGEDRMIMASKSKLKKNSIADFDFLKYEIGLSNGKVEKDVKFSELKKFGISSNFEQGQVLNIDDSFIRLKVKDDSGYASEEIRLAVSDSIEKKIKRPTHMLVTYSNNDTKKIEIEKDQFSYNIEESKDIKKVEIFMGEIKISDGIWRNLQKYWILGDFKNILQENEKWEFENYKLHVKQKSNVPKNNDESQLDNIEINNFKPTLIEIRDRLTKEKVMVVNIADHEWESSYSIKKIKEKNSKKYNFWDTDTFDIYVYNKNNQRLNPKIQKYAGLLTIDVQAPNDDSARRVYIKINTEENDKL